MNSGIVEAWTGVILLKSITFIASKIHSAKGGVKASQALGSFLLVMSGAILRWLNLCGCFTISISLRKRIRLSLSTSGGYQLEDSDFPGRLCGGA
jgi:hypothetical protein